MSANDSDTEHVRLHDNPLFVTILPKERRAKHAYQFCTMMMVGTIGFFQQFFGPPPNASVNLVSQPTVSIINYLCMLVGILGVLAALIPERMVTIKLGRKRIRGDATWFRLYEELGCHALLASIWFVYMVIVWASMGFYKGYGLGLAIGIWMGLAAIIRMFQILCDLKQAGAFDRHRNSAIVSLEDIERRGL